MGLSIRPNILAQQPEEVFLSWLLAQPEGSDLTGAVDAEIARLCGYRGKHPGPLRLLKLFTELRNSLETGTTVQ